MWRMSDSEVARKCSDYLLRHAGLFNVPEGEYWERYKAAGEAVDPRGMIVCLNPIVVIRAEQMRKPLTDGKVEPAGLPSLPPRASNEELRGMGLGDTHRRAQVRLNRGFTYGTWFPYTRDFDWYSPDLAQGPAQPEWESPDVGRIRVRWGALVVRRDGERWQVQTEMP
jgi:hypothetical protein